VIKVALRGLAGRKLRAVLTGIAIVLGVAMISGTYVLTDTTDRQVRRVIRQESVINALIGAALGLPLGIFLAALVNRALSEYDVRFSIPWGQLAILTIVAIVIGILAAITPARRAAKLDPLQAIAYE
jgi:ABC-type antimicrobial peptide transport system permease subunit